MLKNEVWPIISAWDNIEDLIFMQNEAFPHFAIVVREWLNAQFPEKCMGRLGSHEWPARSPDLTPCDFFSLGLVKRTSLVNQTKKFGRT